MNYNFQVTLITDLYVILQDKTTELRFLKLLKKFIVLSAPSVCHLNHELSHQGAL